MNRRRAEAALLFNTIVWGATFVLIKDALADISPWLYLALRFALGTAAMAVLLGGPALAQFSWKAAAGGALSGTFLMAGFALQTFGLRLTTPARSAFLTGLTSIVAPFLAAFVYRLKPRFSEIAGVALSVGGLFLMTFEGQVRGMALGDFLTVLCAVAFAANIVTTGHYAESAPVAVLSLTQVATAAAWATAIFGFAETPRVTWRPAVIWAVLITGLLATALAYYIQAWAMQYTTPTRTALIYMFEPVVAWATSFWATGEGLSARASAGAALILLGIVLVELKPFDRAQHPC